MGDLVAIDGDYGEGGGQIVRTALSVAALTGRAVRIERVRARRKNPGLAAQHLSVVRALAAVCAAEVRGDALGSRTLEFRPGGAARPGDYVVDVAAAREGGSAGAVTLVLQALLLPLALAPGPSTVRLVGGTHTEWSPPFDYVADVFLPVVRALGVEARAELRRFGWYPVGGGEVRASIPGGVRAIAPLRRPERGALVRVRGRAVASRLPLHVAERMADRARAGLATAGIEAEITAELPEASCPGAGIFLTAEYAAGPCGFDALGRRGRPAEAVADEAVRALLGHHRSGAALDVHLADQVLLPAALARAPSAFTTPRATEHLRTHAWVIERFGLARVAIGTAAPERVSVTIDPAG